MSTTLEHEGLVRSEPGTTADRAALPLLSDALLERIGARAADYDRENRFFEADLDELKQAGFLRASVPLELGGLGLTLPELVREQVRLAYRAPATALALNMHLYWAGAALHLWRGGDRSAEWILREIAAGKVFAAGHGEPGNDLGLADSLVKATPLPGGAYRFDGHKILTSLAPAWDWLGVHGRDDSDPANPKIVHAFIRRDSGGHRTAQTWDALGLRATRSDDTWLDGAVVPAAHVIRVLPAGDPDDPFVDGILGAVLPGLGAVYYGIAKRAFDLALASATTRRSQALGGRTYAYKPLTQWSVAEAAIALESIDALLDRTAEQWWRGYAQGEPWLAKLLAAKQHAVDGALRVVNLALQIAGASSLSRRNELERLYRDVRAGAFHPPNADASHELIGQSWLGVLGKAGVPA
ncbi:acyl-CoA dehydrogenase family protein [Paraburkholderia hospita]|uniref:Acyl-CoA dehydrogenase n=1 Tax=Paraburkholderia hospita TaxID=169430 RepID=A0AAN1JHT8_9BURK|nr:acyl-CoA dehydrogenase family protein [Paraburkholderia hospita]AUT73980.1 acyl-CoA dehydrogenase [Paraburkholderia hospita]EIN02880.1 putative acyl-CoA dehydrogenase [Paraburkholderia hospita]OUL78569.1 acyl-CoA dehydrogenase [Paraburkholderia hospita]OUL85961.1 acyl-CoA dehydrogenase [Paraburkholderia hospita]SEH46335.1 Acyl-CoA dehydrogenase [Paraburkholderia hospita]